LDCGRKPEYSGEPTHTQGKYANTIGKGLGSDSNQEQVRKEEDGARLISRQNI